MTIVKWVLSLAVGGFLLLFGFTKFSGAHIFQFIEMNALNAGVPGAALFYPVVNYLTGVLEIVAGLLVIVPQTRKAIGAPLAVVPFIGAVVFHLSPFLGVVTPGGFAETTPDGVISVEAANAAGGGFVPEHFAGETPVLFILAVVFLLLAIANAVLHRREA